MTHQALKTALVRARRGFRDDRRLYLVTVSSLTVAFLCLGAALLGMANLKQLAERWGQSGRLTVYLRDGAPASDVAELRALLEGLPEVASVEHLSAAQARQEFLDQSNVSSELMALPPDVFPASLEATLSPGTTVQRVDALSGRVGRFGVVSDVESYRGWFARLKSLLDTGSLVSAVLALLVFVCALAVVGNTIRLSVAGRRREIEVQKLCGASNGFVAGPFVLEGTLQGILSAFFALFVLLLGFLLLRGSMDELLGSLTGMRAVFLGPFATCGVLLGGALAGALGSLVSLRRYLVV